MVGALSWTYVATTPDKPESEGGEQEVNRSVTFEISRPNHP